MSRLSIRLAQAVALHLPVMVWPLGAYAQDITAPMNQSTSAAAAANATGAGSSGTNGLAGDQGYYRCTSMTWGEACADFYKYGSYQIVGGERGENAPGGTATMRTTNSEKQVANVITGGNTAASATVEVIQLASAQTRSSHAESGILKADVLNGGAAFDITLNHTDGGKTIIKMGPNSTLQQVADKINGYPDNAPLGSTDTEKRYTATIDRADKRDSDDVIILSTDVLTIAGPVGAGNNFTVDYAWGAPVGADPKQFELEAPGSVLVPVDPNDPDGAKVSRDPLGMSSQDAQYKLNNGAVVSGSSNTIAVDGVALELRGIGTTTINVTALSSVVGNGAAGTNVGADASGVSNTFAVDAVETPGQTAITWQSTGGDAGAAQQGGSGGQGGTGGSAKADTVPVINFWPFPPITIPNTHAIAAEGGQGGTGAQGGTGGSAALGGQGGNLSLTLSANSANAQTIASLATTGGKGGMGGVGGTGGQGGTGGAGHASEESSGLKTRAKAAHGGAGGTGGLGGVGGLGAQGGAGGAIDLDATIGSANVQDGFVLRTVGGEGGQGGQGGAGGHGGTGGAGAAIIYPTKILSEDPTDQTAGAVGGTGGQGHTGGLGGKGGTGGVITANFSGNLTATGTGIRASSVGATGGTGGQGGTGGKGGTGGAGAAAGEGGGNTDLTAQATSDRGGHAGGGGHGGDGGVGGKGGDGGNVTVNTHDVDSEIVATNTAIHAESLGGIGGVGGRGGNGGVGGTGGAGAGKGSYTIVIPPGSNVFDVDWVIKNYESYSSGGNGGGGGGQGFGGDGGDGGSGGAVVVTNKQTVRTTGSANATAILGLSLGGIGGLGGDQGSVGLAGSGGQGGKTTATYNGQTIDVKVGDAGAAGAAGTQRAGTAGRASFVGGNGGDVTINNSGTVSTAGASSSAIGALSVGGVNGLSSFKPNSMWWDALPSDAQQSSSGVVNVTNSGALSTDGEKSAGIMAVSQAFDGSSGDVTVDNSGGMTISGDGSSAIIAASRVSDLTRGDAPDSSGGSTGNVSVTHSAGDITITGDEASAIVAQAFTDSANTNAGDVTVALSNGTITGSDKPSSKPLIEASSTARDGTAGDVSVTTSADIVCVADDCVAIELESEGSDGNGDLSLTNSGLIEGGKGGSAIVLTGGASNEIINDQSTSGKDAIIRTKGGIADTVIKGGDADDAIINRNGALLIGSVDLGGGANSLTNEEGSTFISGEMVNLGNGNTFTNHGTFSPGGRGTSMSEDNDNKPTKVTGNYVQSATGEYLVDLDFQTGSGATDRSDMVTFTGTANLAGYLTLEPATGAGKPGTFVLPVFKADGGLTGPGLTINPLFDSGTASTTPIFKPTTYTDATTQYIEYTIDYRPDGLTPNASNVGSTVNDIQNEGVETYQVIANELLRIETLEDLQKANDSLSGEGVIAYQQATLGGRGHMSAGLMSGMNGMAVCAAQDDSADAECSSKGRTWMTGAGGTTRQTGSRETAATSNSAYSMQVGVEQRSIDQTLFGFAVDMSSTSFAVKDRWTSGSTEGISANAYGMGWSSDGLYGKALMSFGAYRNNIERSALDRATGGSFASYAAGTSFEAGARIGGHAADITPFAGFTFDLLYQPGWTETNPTYGNRYDAQLTRSTRINLGLGLDTIIRLGEWSSLKLYSNLGFEHEFSTRRVQTAHSLAAPGFKWNTEGLSAPSDKLMVDLGLLYKPTQNLTVQLKAAHTAHQSGSSSSASLSLSGMF